MPAHERKLTLLAATRIGIGAIVGGGILVLAGAAFVQTGPSAILAFALNGALAALTAMSFAEMASAFPESGGAYAFARRVLSVRAAFAAGWVLWLAYIVAGVLYALGFGVYGMQLVAAGYELVGLQAPPILATHRAAVVAAVLAVALYTLSLIRKPTGGGAASTWGKVVVLTLLVVVGLWALGSSPSGTVPRAMTPFLPGGVSGLMAAMGFTFIALQGFDLIAAVAGDVKEPARTIPRAMFLSLAVALIIYLPLLLVIATVGVEAGQDIRQLAVEYPDTMIAVAVRRYMGNFGYGLVLVAAVLSTLSALHANILAASRVAHTMAGDRTLPWVMGMLHPSRGTPVMAIYCSALAMAMLLFALPDVSAAGAAASLIFLISFALAHLTAYLARKRGGAPMQGAYRSPLFPLVPLLGGVSCVALSAFQAVVAPEAGVIALVWLGLGVVLYLGLFSSRAEAVDAAAEARDSQLALLRGRSPLVLVPIGNPRNAAALVQMASALVPPGVGKVLLLSVVREANAAVEDEVAMTERSVRHGLTRAFELGHRPEAMITVAPEPWNEIERVVEERNCEQALIGLTDLSRRDTAEHLETMMNRMRCDVSVLRAPPEWDTRAVRRVLVPVGGRGVHEELRARLLGSLGRGSSISVHFLRLLPEGTGPAEQAQARRRLKRMATELVRCEHSTEVALASDVRGAIEACAADCDLLVLGLQRLDSGRKVFGELALELARHTQIPLMLLGSRHSGSAATSWSGPLGRG